MDYLVTAVKANQPTILNPLRDWECSTGPQVETVEKSHRQIERRRYSDLDLSDAQWDDYAQLYGRQLALRVDHECTLVKSDEASLEVTYALTSPRPERVTARHWPGSSADIGRLRTGCTT